MGKGSRHYEVTGEAHCKQPYHRMRRGCFCLNLCPRGHRFTMKVVCDDGALLPCAINASCAALVDAGIPLKYLAAAICCGLTTTGSVILDPAKVEEKKMQAFVYLVFPNSPLSVLPNGQSPDEEPIEHGIITSVTHGMMSELDDYFSCLDRGRAACAKISEFLRRSLQSQVPDDGIKAT